MHKKVPFVSILLAVSTLAASFTVATVAKGSPWSGVPILELRRYGGVDNSQLASGEWWRLLTAQFVHVSQAHMLFNVITLLLLAVAIEKAAGSFRLMLLWLISGLAGTYASIYRVPPPYDIGSGASQAIMGLAGAAVVVLRRNTDSPRWLIVTLLITLINGVALDLVFGGHLKPGHAVGFLVGLVFAILLVPKAN